MFKFLWMQGLLNSNLEHFQIQQNSTNSINREIFILCKKSSGCKIENAELIDLKSCPKLQRTLIITKVNKLYLYFQLVQVLAVGTNNICSKLFFGKGRMYKNKLVFKYIM